MRIDLSDKEHWVVLETLEMVRDSESMWNKIPAEDRPDLLRAIELLDEAMA